MDYKIKILGLLAWFIFFGCEKDDNIFPSGIYLKKVIYHREANQIRHYNYNKQGLLCSREYEFDDKITEKLLYQYNRGNINRINYYRIDGNILSQEGYLLYHYDAKKLIRSILYPDGVTTDYEYVGGRLKKIIHSSNSYTYYHYDGSGNIEKAILFIDGYEHWKFAYRYDTKRNPFYEVDPIHDNFSGVDVIKYLSPNNVTFETFVNENNDTISEHEYIYAYNLFDLPAMSYELFTSKLNGYTRDSIHTQWFEYETSM